MRIFYLAIPRNREIEYFPVRVTENEVGENVTTRLQKRTFSLLAHGVRGNENAAGHVCAIHPSLQIERVPVSMRNTKCYE